MPKKKKSLGSIRPPKIPPRQIPSEMPTSPDLTLFDCPACHDPDAGRSVGDVLMALPSGTSVRRTCETCWGLKKIDREKMALWKLRSGKDEAPPSASSP